MFVGSTCVRCFGQPNASIKCLSFDNPIECVTHNTPTLPQLCLQSRPDIVATTPTLTLTPTPTCPHVHAPEQELRGPAAPGRVPLPWALPGGGGCGGDGACVTAVWERWDGRTRQGCGVHAVDTLPPFCLGSKGVHAAGQPSVQLVLPHGWTPHGCAGSRAHPYIRGNWDVGFEGAGLTQIVWRVGGG